MKETISNKQGITILILFLLGSNVVLGVGGAAKKDMWLAVILGFIFVLPAIYIYARLLYLFPRKNLHEILSLVFGNFLGKIISLIYIWFSIHVGALYLSDFSNFINTVGLPETPRIVPDLCFIFLCAFGVKLGIEVISRWSEFFFTIIIIILLIIFLFSTKNFRSENILPILNGGISPILSSAFSVFAFPLSEAVIFTIIFSSLQNKNSYFKVYFSGVAIASLILLTVAFTNILVLGPYIFSLNYYPSYVTVGRISLGDFVQRLDILVSVGFLVSGFVSISLCILAASKGISNFFNFSDYKFIVYPVAILILNISYFVFNDPMEIQKYSKIDPYYKLLIAGILPIIILIFAEIKVHLKKSKKANS